MMFNGYKLPKITTTLSDTIRLFELKEAKNHMKEHKPLLEDYTVTVLERTEDELRIRYSQIYAIEAMYFEASSAPVLHIKAEAYDRTDYTMELFVQIFASMDDSPSICHRYEKVS